MSAPPHPTRPVLVWVDVDKDVADLVAYLQTVAGVRTHSSCQGTRGEGGPAPSGPYVTVSWTSDAVLARLQKQFDVTVEGINYGTLRPRSEEGAP